MREPISLFEQSNAYKKSNRQRLLIDQTAQRPRPVRSSFSRVHDDELELKHLSFDVYTNQHLLTSGKPTLPSGRRQRWDEIVLPSIEKDFNRDNNPTQRVRRRPAYRKSLYHSETASTFPEVQPQLTTRGTRTEIQITIPLIRDDETVFSYQRHHAPPPSPSDNEIERLLTELQDRNPSRPSSRQSPVDREDYVPFRLPALNQSARTRRTSTKSPCKNIRSTLSNYLQKYYWVLLHSNVSLKRKRNDLFAHFPWPCVHFHRPKSYLPRVRLDFADAVAVVVNYSKEKKTVYAHA